MRASCSTVPSRSAFRRGFVGESLLYRFDIVYDYAREQVWIDPKTDIPLRPFNRGGLRLRKDAPDAFTVIFVAPNSPAEMAKIKEGDQIRSIGALPRVCDNGCRSYFRTANWYKDHALRNPENWRACAPRAVGFKRDASLNRIPPRQGRHRIQWRDFSRKRASAWENRLRSWRRHPACCVRLAAGRGTRAARPLARPAPAQAFP